LFFGERVIDFEGYQRRGITVALGTDSCASNNSQNMFADLRVAALSQRLRARDPAVVSVTEMLALCTSQGGEVTGLPVGRLEAGFFADFLVLDANDLSLQPIDRLESHLVYSFTPRAIKGVYVGGNRVVRDGQLVDLDVADVIGGINQLARRS
jgi:5-methylthioadenosine/S-adenosylhomocysteine deaminase